MRETPEPTTDDRRTASVRTVLLVGLIAMGTATLLNAESLLETAERQPIDSRLRGLSVGIMEPIATFSNLVGLDVPRDLLEQAIGRGESLVNEDPPAAAAEASTTTTSPPITTTTSSTTTTLIEDSGQATSTTITSSTSTSTSTTTTTIPRPTTDDPLSLWVIGDSFMELLGPAIRNEGFETGVVEAQTDFRFISGLVRPDYFDWPAYIVRRFPEVQPDAVVVMFGGNDGQPFRDPEGWIAVGTPEWHARYGAVVGEAMDLLLELGAERVYWIGLPIMKSSKFTEKSIGMNEVYQAEADERPAVTYVSSFEVFQDENGEYATFLRDENGSLQRMRAPDGAHLLWPGAYRLATVVLDVIAVDWGFSIP